MTKYSIDLKENTVYRNEEFCVGLQKMNKLEGETTILKTEDGNE